MLKRNSLLLIFFIWFFLLINNLFSEENFQLIAKMSGENDGDQFSVVAGVGDVNNDGSDDILVGAPGGDYAKLYLGGSPFDTIPDLKFTNNQPGSYFGNSVAGNGDFNGDGFSDIAIGAPYYGEYNSGKVYLYFGGAAMDSIPDLILEEFGYYYHFGESVSMAGDVNNDSFDDIIIGAPNDDMYAQGRAFIYFGGENMNDTADVYLEGEEEYDNFGCSVSWAGDVNRDGYDEVLVGAPQEDKGAPGKTYIIYGGENINLNNSYKFIGDSSYMGYGRTVSGLGDVNGDNYTDFGNMSMIKVEIISGKTLELLNEIPVTEQFQTFQAISDGGEINRDGFYDLLVGISKESIEYAGTAEIYFGNSEFDSIPDYIINGSTAKYYFGSSLDQAGDINNDGYNEIIIGEKAYSGPDGPVGRGSAYIYSYTPGSSIKKKDNFTVNKFYNLKQNYPNPFNSTTRISYEIYYPCNISSVIFDCTGQKIKTLISSTQKFPGIYEIMWDGKSDSGAMVSSGVYYLKMIVKSSDFNNKIISEYKKLVYLK